MRAENRGRSHSTSQGEDMLIQVREEESPVKGKLHQMKLTGQEDFIKDYGNRGERLNSSQ